MSVLQSYLQGRQAARQEAAYRRENAMQQYVAQNAGGIFSGDEKALSGYAAFDPMAALNIRSMHNNERRAEAASKRAAAASGRAASANARAQQLHDLKVQEYMRNLSVEEAAAEAAQIRTAVQRGLSTTSAEQWDSLMESDPDLHMFKGQWEDRENIARGFLDIADQLELMQSPKRNVQNVGGTLYEIPAEGPVVPLTEGGEEQFRPATPEEAGGYGAQAGQFGPDGRFYPINPPSGMSIEADGQGGFTLSQGPGVAPKLTVEAGKNTGFLLRTQEANEVLNRLDEQGTSFVQQNLENVPLGAGNYFRTPEFQQYDQARRDFVNAILRRESGAVISEQEFDNANKQYFPVPGDGPEVIAQKRRNRETAIEGLRVGAGAGAAYIDQQQDSGPWPMDSDPPPPGVDPDVWQWLSPEDRALFR